MKAIIPDFQTRSAVPLYLQLYNYVKAAILDGSILPSERLPSLRSLSKSLGLSITTIELAYNQLLVEGYIYSKPQSGYYVNRISSGMGSVSRDTEFAFYEMVSLSQAELLSEYEKNGYYDASCFDFVKWKKCINQVLTEYSYLLLSEGNPQGEKALRQEISKYVYQSRGVICTPEQIVIGAGTQQITGQLCTILIKTGLKHVTLEEPGYLPVRNIFRDRDFAITAVPVGKEGIPISKLPVHIRSAIYVSPSNQFPTGYVMPIGKRYELLDWATKNDSIVIEDDYDSELRYFGKPIPSLQGLDHSQKVVYLGSFSSTLFPSIKISYMILPPYMAEIFDTFRGDYTQTCSKTEQLTLALYMSKGLYQKNIKKLRTLYSQKLQVVLSLLEKWGKGFIKPIKFSSGLNMLLSIKSKKTASQLCQEAKELGISTLPIASYAAPPTEDTVILIFYYNQIPLKDMEPAVKDLIAKWKGVISQ
ncbi:MAG: PLP-dependent aminotransferase family protein [Eubacteriales bacterium]|nr:PLP-dependent aminotransferase family protein [Eubacteriales bacterium]MDD4629164.1 PLP-dependent aminotransferase family protein [Eubacteriales bacterium]